MVSSVFPQVFNADVRSVNVDIDGGAVNDPVTFIVWSVAEVEEHIITPVWVPLLPDINLTYTGVELTLPEMAVRFTEFPKLVSSSEISNPDGALIVIPDTLLMCEPETKKL
jgi:hypothetical protein